MRQQQEVIENDDHHRIPPASHLQKFHRCQDDQQTHPGVAAEQRAELKQDAGAGENDQADQQPATGQSGITPPQPGGPDEQQA